MISIVFLLLLSGCAGKAETVVQEEKSTGYEVIENADERFLMVVVDAKEAATVTLQKEQGEAESLTLLGAERVFGTILDEEGYYEIQVTSGGATQKRVVHVEDPSVYSLWFSF